MPVLVEGGDDAGAAVGRVQVPQIAPLQRVTPAAERHRLEPGERDVTDERRARLRGRLLQEEGQVGWVSTQPVSGSAAQHQVSS